MNHEVEIVQSTLISIQRALLGMVYPGIRAIAVGMDGLNEFEIIFYLNRAPVHEDYETIKDVTGEVCADVAFKTVKEQCVYSEKPVMELNPLMFWVYIRKES